MAIHDYIINNQSFPSTRQDINAVLQAIVSNNSNATAPTTTYAYQFWYDTGTHILKIRNSANNAWLELASFDQTNNKWSITPNGSINGKGDGINGGILKLFCETNAHAISIQSPPHSANANWVWKLPVNTGSAGNVLSTDGNATGQLSWINASETKPIITSINPTAIAPTTASNIVITGQNFVITPKVEFINANGVITFPNTITQNSTTQLTVNATLASGSYFIFIMNPDGNATRSSTQILQVSSAPTFSTANLGSFAKGDTVSLQVTATSDSAVTYAHHAGNIPTGLTLDTATGVISGTESGTETSETIFNFTIRATDQENQFTDQAHTVTLSVGINNGIQFN